MNEYSNEGMKTLHQPQLSEWRCVFIPSPYETYFRPVKGKEPNWFWRKMQYLILGFRWVKDE